MAEDESSNTEFLLQSVYVKMEVVEEGVVEGIDVDSEGEYPEQPEKKIKKLEENFLCDKCDYKTTRRQYLKFHLMKHTNTKLTCKLCPFTSKYPYTIQRHIMSVHSDKTKLPIYKCTDCSYESIHKTNLNKHMRKHCKKNYYYKCELCPFQTKGDLIKHLAEVHNVVPEEAIKCEQCSFVTRTKWRLSVHLKRSFKKVEMSCRKCTFSTNFMCVMREHKNEHAGPKSESKVKKMAEEMNYETETTSNSQEMNTEADINLSENALNMTCNSDSSQEDKKSNTSSKNLQISKPKMEGNVLDSYINWREIPVKERNSQDKPFSCTMCVFSSRFKAVVQKHFQRLHMNLKPYSCVNCDFTTKTKDSLGTHNRRSISASVQKCQNCPFETYYNCELIFHQKTHYKFKCKLCNHSSKTKYYLQKHYTNIHHTTYTVECDEDQNQTII